MALGAAWQASPRLLVCAQVKQLRWSNALQSTALILSRPDNAAAPPELAQYGVVNARNQIVWAIGIAHELLNQSTLYVGFNYGKNPIPPKNLTPLIAAIGEAHVTGGIKAPLDKDWAVSGAFEYLLPKSVRYENPSFPLGASTERVSYMVAATSSQATAQSDAQLEHFHAAGRYHNVAMALERAAGAGDREAQTRIGLMYRYGEALYGPDLPRDAARATYWLRRAAEQGSDVARHALAANASAAGGVTGQAK
ncbi:MAG: hypothetical protein ABI624_17645 [Casimicrobiaceae bacterium]